MRVLTGLRSLVREARHAPDRLSHARRRQRAEARIEQISMAAGSSVLFVCHGNICRSPYAAAVFNACRPGGAPAASAGFIGPDRPAHRLAQLVASERGLDLSRHRSRLLADELVSDVDLVVVMTPAQARQVRARGYCEAGKVLILGDLDPLPIPSRAIPDPYGLSKRFFEEVFTRIDRCVESLVKNLEGAPD